MILSIDKNYLLSLLPGLAMGFRCGWTGAEELDARYSQRVDQGNASVLSGGGVYVLPIKGAIVKHTSYNYIGTQRYIAYLRELDRDERVSSIVLDIDSGGGMVSGTAELAHAISAIEKPIVAYTNGMLCSAAYWIASSCDAIVSSPFADAIGSIGTLLQYEDYRGILEKWGARLYEVYAPQSSLKNKPWRELAAGKAEGVEQRLEAITDRFVAHVKGRRPQLKDDGAVFKGQSYTPEEALAIGLVDQLMSLEELLNSD